MRQRLSVTKKQERQKDGHRKFLLGLSFEKTGLALANNAYLNSEQALQICQSVLLKIDQESGVEHDFYRAGEAAFNSKAFMEEEEPIKEVEALFGEDWKRTRYHNLVRLGGDILRSGLAGHPKATILGALFWHKKIAQKVV